MKSPHEFLPLLKGAYLGACSSDGFYSTESYVELRHPLTKDEIIISLHDLYSSGDSFQDFKDFISEDTESTPELRSFLTIDSAFSDFLLSLYLAYLVTFEGSGDSSVEESTNFNSFVFTLGLNLSSYEQISSNQGLTEEEFNSNLFQIVYSIFKSNEIESYIESIAPHSLGELPSEKDVFNYKEIN